jgi:hypothetical protein
VLALAGISYTEYSYKKPNYKNHCRINSSKRETLLHLLEKDKRVGERKSPLIKPSIGYLKGVHVIGDNLSWEKNRIQNNFQTRENCIPIIAFIHIDIHRYNLATAHSKRLKHTHTTNLQTHKSPRFEARPKPAHI